MRAMRLVKSAVALLAALSATVAGAAGIQVPLIEAVKGGNHEAVRTLIDQRADVNAAEADGATALHWAVQGDDLEAVERLLSAGADVARTTRYGVAPLSLAVTNGNAGMVSRLLTAGADPNTTLPGGETVLMTAARVGRADVITVLLRAGADPNAREDARSQTALMWAASENNVDAVRLLLAAGAERDARTADPAARPAPGSGAFSSATGVAANAASRGPSFTAFLFAVQLGQLDAARALADAGADVNQALPDGTSALVLATMNGQWELAMDLVDRGADVNADEQGWTALHQLARIRRTNIGFLPPPAGQGTNSSTDLARSLIAHGADVNILQTRDFRDGYRNRLNRVGATPFLLAAKNVDTELMRILLDAGADPLKANADGTTPLMVAAGVDMWNPGEDGGTEPAYEPEALEAVRLLVDLGNDVNAANDRGETALHGAAYRGANSIAEYLVAKGAKLDARSRQGWTPWTIANGVFYTLFFKEQPHTAKRLEELMAEQGLSTVGMEDDGRTCFDCGRNNRVARDAEGTRVAQPKPDAVPRIDEIDLPAAAPKPPQ